MFAVFSLQFSSLNSHIHKETKRSLTEKDLFAVFSLQFSPLAFYIYIYSEIEEKLG